MLEQRLVGRRVTVRRVLGRSAAGRTQFGDVVGDLLSLDASTAVIDTRTGPVEVSLDTVVIAKAAPPSTADELALQTVAAAGWRAADTGHVGGWLLRADNGFTSRANSVLPLRAPGIPLDHALAQAGAWYHQHGLPLRLQVPTEARRLLDAELGERGWPTYDTTLMMAARLDQLRAARPDVEVRLDRAPDDAWLARYRDGAAPTDIARALLTRHEAAVFASVRDGSDCLAVGRGVVDEGWLGIAAVEVAPDARRRGLANAVVAALWDWSVERTATHSYVQVRAENDGAVALYEKQGYWVHHDYRYRIEPDA